MRLLSCINSINTKNYQAFSPDSLLPVDTVNLLAMLFLKLGTL
jgi:hypothetical protein